MKKLVTLSLLLCSNFCSQAQTPSHMPMSDQQGGFPSNASTVEVEPTSCVSDSLKLETIDTMWTVIANNFGASNYQAAQTVSTQLNGLPGYNAQWISYKTDWIQYTSATPSAADSFMTLRYTFKNCQPDSVNFDFLLRRDNYCSVTLDGNIILFNESPTNNLNNVYAGDQIFQSVYLDTCTHNLDITVYNRCIVSGGNGFGLFVAGWIVSKNKTLFTNAAGCGNYVCCFSPTRVSNTIAARFSVHPNPVSGDDLTISLPDGAKPTATFVIQNNLGQMIKSGTIAGKETRVSLANIPPGAYYLSVNGFSGAVKVIKQ